MHKIEKGGTNKHLMWENLNMEEKFMVPCPVKTFTNKN